MPLRRERRGGTRTPAEKTSHIPQGFRVVRRLFGERRARVEGREGKRGKLEGLRAKFFQRQVFLRLCTSVAIDACLTLREKLAGLPRAVCASLASISIPPRSTISPLASRSSKSLLLRALLFSLLRSCDTIAETMSASSVVPTSASPSPESSSSSLARSSCATADAYTSRLATSSSTDVGSSPRTSSTRAGTST